VCFARKKTVGLHGGSGNLAGVGCYREPCWSAKSAEVAAITDALGKRRHLSRSTLEFLAQERLVPTLCLVQVGRGMPERTLDDAGARIDAAPEVALVDPFRGRPSLRSSRRWPRTRASSAHAARQDISGLLATRFGATPRRARRYPGDGGVRRHRRFRSATPALANELLGPRASARTSSGPDWAGAAALQRAAHVRRCRRAASAGGVHQARGGGSASGSRGRRAHESAAGPPPMRWRPRRSTPETAWKQLGGLRGPRHARPRSRRRARGVATGASRRRSIDRSGTCSPTSRSSRYRAAARLAEGGRTICAA